jgi:hypothetical protein
MGKDIAKYAKGLRDERDELLEAFKEAMPYLEGLECSMIGHQKIHKWRKILEKYKK